MSEPSDAGYNGRSPGGQFGLGNRYGKGNPTLKKIGAMRRAVFEAVTAEDLEAIFTKLVALAKTGDLAAARMVVEYACGKPVAPVSLTLEEPEPPTADEERQRLLLSDPWYAEKVIELQMYAAETSSGASPEALTEYRRRAEQLGRDGDGPGDVRGRHTGPGPRNHLVDRAGA